MTTDIEAIRTEPFLREAAELPAVDDGPLALHTWFDFASASTRALELEIGSGKGTFLVQAAAEHPAVDYLGIEYARAYARHAADRVRRHGLANVRLFHGEALGFVRSYCPDRAFTQVHIYFPDPWPKKRHHKRRLIQPPFLRELWRVLESPPSAQGQIDDHAQDRIGCVHLCTDHGEYFAWMEQAGEAVGDQFDRLEFMRPVGAEEGELAGTNFERKYRAQGRRFHGMTLRKRI